MLVTRHDLQTILKNSMSLEDMLKGVSYFIALYCPPKQAMHELLRCDVHPIFQAHHFMLQCLFSMELSYGSRLLSTRCKKHGCCMTWSCTHSRDSVWSVQIDDTVNIGGKYYIKFMVALCVLSIASAESSDTLVAAVPCVHNVCDWLQNGTKLAPLSTFLDSAACPGSVTISTKAVQRIAAWVDAGKLRAFTLHQVSRTPQSC